jgi:hypothetical protein
VGPIVVGPIVVGSIVVGPIAVGPIAVGPIAVGPIAVGLWIMTREDNSLWVYYCLKQAWATFWIIT